MSFVTVLLALFIDRIAWDGTPYRQHQWFYSYVRKFLASGIGSPIIKSGYAAAILILPIVALVGWLQVSVLPSLGGLLEFAFASTLLLFSLGPRDLGRDVEAYLNAQMSGNLPRAEEYAEHTRHKSEQTDPSQQMADGIFQAACWRLIGPIFWFVLFGACGAVTYRLIHLLATKPAENTSPRLESSIKTLRSIADWAPARITAAGFAVAGNFDAVAAAWKTFSQDGPVSEQSEASGLLIETGRAALNHDVQQSPSLVADSLALVWRNLTLWVVFIGVISLVSQL